MLSDFLEKEEKMTADKLSRQQKKELGILPVQVLAHLKDADADKNMNAKELAFVYATYACDNTEFALAWVGVQQGTYGVDWDSIIAFLEKIMELLLKFLPLFI
jgi:hypothetical protein